MPVNYDPLLDFMGVPRPAKNLSRRVMRWHSRKTAELVGHAGTWTYDTREVWARESNISLKQYDRNSVLLVELGFIERVRHPPRGSIVYIRLSEDIAKAVEIYAKEWDALPRANKTEAMKSWLANILFVAQVAGQNECD